MLHSWSLTSASIAAAVILCGATTAADDRPDVLMIVVDDLRPMLGCYGDTRIQSPNIDQLASESVVFDNAYCQYAKCGTSRLSFMTGLRPDSIGVFSNNSKDVAVFRKRRPDAHSIASWLTRAGYHTQSFGKVYHDGWDRAEDWSVPSSPGREREILEIVDEEHPTAPSVIADRFACPVIQAPDVPDDHLFAGRMTEQVVAAIREYKDTKPKFLAVGYRRPHLPFVAPKKYHDLYRPDTSWLARNRKPSPKSPIMAWFNSDGYTGAAKRFGLTMPQSPTRQQAIDLNGFEMRSYLGVPKSGTIDDNTQLELLRAYAACVSFVDAQIGQLVDALEQSGRRERTIVILFSDHGWHLGEQSAWGKMTNFELATRVPLLISAPGVAPKRTKCIAELVDIYPTLCELTGHPSPRHLEGESLLECLKETASQNETQALSQYSRFQERYMGRAIRTSDYRYVAWYDNASEKIIEEELYDHRRDPAESDNLASNPVYNSIRTRLRQRIANTKR